MATRGRKLPGPSRKIPQAVLDIFDKYINNNVRTLHKAEAIAMLGKEFNLTPEQGEEMFNTFDQDKNELFSIWEFQQFYETIGNSAQAMIEKFQEMDEDKSGKLDHDEAKKGLQSIELAGGKKLQDREIDFFLKSSMGADQQIDLAQFGALLYKLKMYEKKMKK